MSGSGGFGLLIGLAVTIALLIGVALAITRVDHIFLNRRLENLEARVNRLERPRSHAGAAMSNGAPTHLRSGVRAQVRTSADQEEST